MTNANPGDWAVNVQGAVRAELEARSFAHTSGPEGEIVVPFEHADGRRFAISFATGSTPEHGLVALAAPAPPVEREKWAALLFALNNWNATTTGPKAHLRADDWVADDRAIVLLETWLPFPPSGAVDRGQIGAMIDAMCRSCALFILPDLLAGAQS